MPATSDPPACEALVAAAKEGSFILLSSMCVEVVGGLGKPLPPLHARNYQPYQFDYLRIGSIRVGSACFQVLRLIAIGFDFKLCFGLLRRALLCFARIGATQQHRLAGA